MIKLNGVEIKLDKYPDGTFLFKDIPPIGGWCRDNIEWFLNKHKDAKVEKIFLGNMDNFMYNNDGSLTILPNEYMDGFYVAKIIKK